MKRLFCILALVISAGAWASPTYEIADATLIDTSASGILTQAWAPDGRHLAYIVDPFGESDLYVIDVTDLSTKHQVLGAGNTIDSSSLAWSPDGNYVLFSSNDQKISKVKVSDGTVTSSVLSPSDLGLGAGIVLRDPCVVVPASGAAMVVAAVDMSPPQPVSAGIWAININNDGSIAGSPKLLVNITDHLFGQPSVELSGDNTIDAVSLVEPWTSTENKLWYVSALTNVFSGATPPVTSVADPKVAQYGGTGYHVGGLVSNDGSLVFYSKDYTGLFNANNLASLDNSDFDLSIATYYHVLDHTDDPFRVTLPGNQGTFSSAPGGTRLAYVTGLEGSSFPGALNLATLKVTDSVTLDGAGRVVSLFDLHDGAGTRLVLPPNVVIGGMANPSATTLPITMYTPVTPLQEIANIGITGTPVHRAFLPSGLTFDSSQTPQPASLYIKYTDAEVVGFDENTLQLYEIGSDQMLRNVSIITRDPTHNYIVGVVTGFSHYVLTSPSQVDSDNDGWSDATETANVTDPHDATSHPDLSSVPYDMPLVDSDGDGWSDQLENQHGTNPNDVNSHPSVPQDLPIGPPQGLPATSPIGLAFMAALLGVAAIFILKKKDRLVQG